MATSGATILSLVEAVNAPALDVGLPHTHSVHPSLTLPA
jgi:hypothetical protein